MARISYDEQTAAAFKAVREVPRDGLSERREAVERHLRPSQGLTLVDTFRQDRMRGTPLCPPGSGR